MRAWCEGVLAALSAIAFVVTLINPMWFESLTDTSPDAGSGEFEWGIAGLLGVAALALGLLARRDFRLLRPAGPDGA